MQSTTNILWEMPVTCEQKAKKQNLKFQIRFKPKYWGNCNNVLLPAMAPFQEAALPTETFLHNSPKNHHGSKFSDASWPQGCVFKNHTPLAFEISQQLIKAKN